MRLLLVGPPGAGKGTQAARIAGSYGVPAISTGDIFRANVADGTELGEKAKSYMDRGAYVPDELTIDLVIDRLGQQDAARGFLLDGFPRTPMQVDRLDGYLDERGERLDVVVQIVAAAEEVVRRLLIRASEQGRSDDTEAVIRDRLHVYERQTEPLVDIYSARGLLVAVDGLGPVDLVTRRILDALATRGYGSGPAALS